MSNRIATLSNFLNILCVLIVKNGMNVSSLLKLGFRLPQFFVFVMFCKRFASRMTE